MVAYLVAPNSIFWSKHRVEVTQYTPRVLHVFSYVYKAFPKALLLMFLVITIDKGDIEMIVAVQLDCFIVD